MAKRKKGVSPQEPNIVKLGLTIGLSAVAGHLVGQWLRPRLRPYLGTADPAPAPERAAEAAAETMTEDDAHFIAVEARQILPGIAVALFVRNLLGARLTPLGIAAFLGSLILTVIADTKYDQEARSIIKTVAPGGQFLA